MASPAAEHRQSGPPPHGSARPDPCGHGADPGHAEPRQRSSWGQEGAEHGDGAEATRPFPCSGRPAPSATEESSSLPFDQASRRLIRAFGIILSGSHGYSTAVPLLWGRDKGAVIIHFWTSGTNEAS